MTQETRHCVVCGLLYPYTPKSYWRHIAGAIWACPIHYEEATLRYKADVEAKEAQDRAEWLAKNTVKKLPSLGYCQKIQYSSGHFDPKARQQKRK